MVFLDRDGVINKEIGYLHKIDDFEFIDGVFKACGQFMLLGYKIIIITNQSGIGRGLYKDNDFHILNKWMLNQFSYKGVEILDVLYCPHNPEDDCKCRKPKPGLLMEAIHKHDIDVNKSWMIGDKETDIESSINAGINHNILVRSGHEINIEKTRANHVVDSIKFSTNIIRS